jgi:hypothetical protein
MIAEEDLIAAAATVRSMPQTVLDQRLSELEAERKRRSDFSTASQDADLDATQLDEAAYQLARQYHADGKLAAAARWYRTAALNDYADAALQLGYVLERLAENYLNGPLSAAVVRDELNLVIDAAQWYADALGAGYFEEAAERVDRLISRHDPSRPRSAPHAPVARPAPDPAPCDQGGLQAVNQRCLVEEAVEHVRQCLACQQELMALGGMLPIRSSAGPARPATSAQAAHPGSPAEAASTGAERDLHAATLSPDIRWV